MSPARRPFSSITLTIMTTIVRLQFFYHRIKILTDAGRQYANVEIPIDPLFHFVDLKARTIHPDGSIVEFTGKPFEKTIVKTRRH